VSLLRKLLRLVLFPVTITLLAARIAVGVRLLPEERRPRYRALGQAGACRLLTRILGVHVRTEGIPAEEGARLLVSNHLGGLDGFALGATIPLAFVAKIEMASWPVAGWICRTVGVIFVDRRRRADAGRMVESIRARMRDRVPVLVFPEGTVGDGQRLLPFRTGAFEAAAGAEDVEVLPAFMTAERVDSRTGRHAHEAIVWHQGESMQAHLWRLLGCRRIDVLIRFGNPIQSKGRSRKAILDAARAEMQRLGTGVLASE